MADQDYPTKHKENYSSITQKVKNKDSLSLLQVKTILNHLIKLPETYKNDFVEIHLKDLILKSDPANRDQCLYEHYKHYVSISCLSGFLNVLNKTELDYGPPILDLVNHIRNLQLVPGSQAKDREQLESLQFDLIELYYKIQKSQKKLKLVDLRSPEKISELALLFYNRMMSSFISQSEDDLVTEGEFILQLKEEFLRSSEIKAFASQINQGLSGDQKEYIQNLGKIILTTTQKTYTEIYRGIFNGDKEFLLSHFEKAIENRCLDSEDKEKVDLDAITSSIMGVTLEHIFNSGYSSFRETLSDSIYGMLKE